MKKIFIILISLSIIGIVLFLYIDNFNMNNNNYIMKQKEYYHVNLDGDKFVSNENYTNSHDYTKEQLDKLQNRNTIIYTILLILSVSDIILIFTIKNTSPKIQ